MKFFNGLDIRADFYVGAFRCLVVVGPSEALNGYMLIPAGHVWHQRDYDEIERYWSAVEVHGGLTYSCEVSGEWWIGFDCAHFDDWSRFNERGHRWTELEVSEELRRLAAQAADARPVVLGAKS